MDASVPPDALGRRVSCDTHYGTVRYVGSVSRTAGIWLGVEWDDPQRGKHDGSYEGTQYFKCRHPKGGSFIRPNKANFGVDFLTAVKDRYGLNDKQDVQYGTENTVVFGTKTVEFVGMDSVAEQQRQRGKAEGHCTASEEVFQSVHAMFMYLEEQLNKLIDISVRECAVSHAGETEEISRTCARCKTKMFPSLKRLAINDNKISQWSSINELDKLPSLRSLQCNNNPLMDTEKNPETLIQLIIAKISQLEVLNNCEILPAERRGAELDYRKIFGNDWLAAGGHWNPEKNKPSEEFLAAHPRYPSLCLTLTIKCPEKPEQKPVEKKLPESMTIQKVKGLLYRLFKIPGSELKLSYESSKLEGKEVELDNDLKPLQFYSIESGDCVLVRW
ncbi:tubulin-specific chaperone E [Willisornis vidua]|uniref:Tubulin-specific chaperone E n=1 Tax=Willisornis vidua TaxID=1566151 RepID=A0ABQ9DW02_9PASS|nr:tubulin-specific chaperone E [Willisornis vidua]